MVAAALLRYGVTAFISIGSSLALCQMQCRASKSSPAISHCNHLPAVLLLTAGLLLLLFACRQGLLFKIHAVRSRFCRSSIVPHRSYIG
jgi:hypothetical protein